MSTQSVPRTKKEARNAGMLSAKELETNAVLKLAPARDAVPIIVKGESFYRSSQCEELISRTEARRRRLVIPANVLPEKTVKFYGRGSWREYSGFRVSDCVPMRPRPTVVPPTTVDLLAAIFAVNKSAKRDRDAASALYDKGQHAFAQARRKKKQELYQLKDQGIARAVREGRLHYVGCHAGLALYRGEGYCFHSTLAPLAGDEPSQGSVEFLFIESSPRETSEVRLKDAVFTLRQLDEDLSSFHRLVRPIYPRHRHLARPSAVDGCNRISALAGELGGGVLV